MGGLPEGRRAGAGRLDQRQEAAQQTYVVDCQHCAAWDLHVFLMAVSLRSLAAELLFKAPLPLSLSMPLPVIFSGGPGTPAGLHGSGRFAGATARLDHPAPWYSS
jgi:hypothetical protein